MIYRCPLTQSNFNSLQEQFRFQELAKELAEGAKAHSKQAVSNRDQQRDGHDTPTRTGHSALSILGQLVVAAPSIIAAINDIRDPVVQEGNPPVRQSHLLKLCVVSGLALGTPLTLEEETTLIEFSKKACSGRNAKLRSSILALADLASDIDDEVSATWLKQAVELFNKFVQSADDPTYLYWASGVRARARLVPEALPAAEKRDVIAAYKNAERELDKLGSSIKEFRESNAELAQEIKALQDALKNGKTAAKAAAVALKSLLNAEPANTEALLRQHLVQGKDAWTSLLIDPHISGRKLSTARSSCRVPLSERVIALFDLTFFGSASEALIFGVSGIYFRTKQSPVTIPYPKLNEFRIVCQVSLTLSGMGSEFAVMGTLGGTDVVQALESVRALFA